MGFKRAVGAGFGARRILGMFDGLRRLSERIVLDPEIVAITSPLHTKSYPPPTDIPNAGSQIRHVLDTIRLRKAKG